MQVINYKQSLEQGNDRAFKDTLRRIDSSIQSTKISLTQTQINSLNSVPIIAIANPGVGKIIKPISMFARFNYGSHTFSGGADIHLTTISINESYFELQNILSLASNTITDARNWIDQGNVSTDVLLDNSAMYLKADGDSTSGIGCSIDIYITYKIVTL